MSDITWGSSSSPASTTTVFSNYALCEIDTNKFVLVYLDMDNAGVGYAVVATVSGTTISFGTPVEFDNNVDAAPNVCKLDTNKFVIAFSNGDDADDGYCRV